MLINVKNKLPDEYQKEATALKEEFEVKFDSLFGKIKSEEKCVKDAHAQEEAELHKEMRKRILELRSSGNVYFRCADGKYMILPTVSPERFYSCSGETVKERNLCFTKDATDEIIKEYAEYYKKHEYLD